MKKGGHRRENRNNIDLQRYFHPQLLGLPELVSLLLAYFKCEQPLFVLSARARIDNFVPNGLLARIGARQILRISKSECKSIKSCTARLRRLQRTDHDLVLIDPALCGAIVEDRLQQLGFAYSKIVPLSDALNMELVLNEQGEWELNFYQLGRSFYEEKNYRKSKLWLERFIESQTSPQHLRSKEFTDCASRCAHRVPQLLEAYRARDQRQKVSVVMATWNRSFIIGRAIESVLAQQYRNFELIVVDDGSTDDTEKVVRTYAGRDSRVRYIQEDHVGVSHARNVGLQNACGKLVAYLDSDNEWSEDYLLLMVNQFIDHPALSTGYCAIQVIDAMRARNFTRFKPFDRQSLLSLNYIDLNIFMHRADLFRKLGGFNETLKRLVDWELIIRYTKRHPPFFLNLPLAKYYLSKNLKNITYTVPLEKNMQKVRELHGEI